MNPREITLAACIKGGLYLEFGVSTGSTLRDLRGRIPPEITLYGFDSFEGIPHEWCGNPKGSFATQERIVLPNTVLIEGWFEDTLDTFVAAHPGHVSFMHIDCDVYSATKTVFTALRERIVAGTTIAFDEYFGQHPDAADHEAKAFTEFLSSRHDLSFEVLARDAVRFGVKIINV